MNLCVDFGGITFGNRNILSRLLLSNKSEVCNDSDLSPCQNRLRF